MQSVAVANGDHLEAFSTGTEHDTPIIVGLDDTSESEPDVQAGGDSQTSNRDAPIFESCADSFNGKEKQEKLPKHVYSKPCPKSKKVGLQNNCSVDDPFQNNKTNESVKKHSGNGSVEGEELELIKLPEETENISEKLQEIDHTVHEVDEQLDDKVTKPTKDDDIQKSELDSNNKECNSEFEGNDHSEFQESTNEPTNGLDNGTAKSQSKVENEGIVTEPEDETWGENLIIERKSAEHEPSDMLDQVPDNLSDTEQQAVTITAVDAESVSSNEENSTVEYTNGSEADFVEEYGETTTPLIEFPNDSPNSSPEVLHHCDNPIDSINENDQEVESEYDDPDDMEEVSKIDEQMYTYAQSLRFVSGRRAMKPSRGENDEVPSASKTSQSSIFSFPFGKRKAENDDESPKKQANKRIKADEGVDSLGFFAKLTSPIVNRLRRMKVPSIGKKPSEADDDRWSADGEEFVGHEELPVAIIGSPPASKWCSIM